MSAAALTSAAVLASLGSEFQPPPSGSEPKTKAKAEKPPRFVILGADEIAKPIPEDRWLFGGLIRRGSICLMVAHGSSLKSWMCGAAVLDCASGTTFLGRFTTLAAGPARYVDWEDGADEKRRRFQLLAAGNGTPGKFEGVSLVSMPNLFATHSDFEAQLTLLAEGQHLLILDSLAAMSPGVDENSSAFALPLQTAKRVAERTDCAIVFVHHARKAKEGVTDEREMVRGTSATFAACDMILGLVPAPEQGDAKAFICRPLKQRAGVQPRPFKISLQEANGGLRVVASDPTGPAPQDPVQEAGARILRLLARRHDLRTKNAIVAELGIKRELAFKAIESLEERKLIVLTGEGFRLASEVRR